MANKKFNTSGDTAVFTTKFVAIDKKNITKVIHDEDDGAWQFHSNDNVNNFEDVAKIVSLDYIVKIDTTVLEIADMEEGYSAYRKFKGDKWIIKKNR